MFIISLFIQIIIAVFIIRFHVSIYHLGFNPLIEKLNQLTDPLVLPFRKIPLFDPTKRMQYRNNAFLYKILGYNLPALLVGFLVALLIGLLFGRMATGMVLFISTWINVIYYAIFIVVIGSWLQTDDNQPVMQIAKSCCEWLLAPLRNIIPPLGMFDISPIVALLLLSLFSQSLGKLFF